MSQVDLTLTDGIARITLSNPAKYNAMSFGMWTGLGDIVESLLGRDDVRVLVLRGAGEKAFVSGADISEFETQRGSADAVDAYNKAVARAQNALTDFPLPVIAHIHGVCMGGGIGLALACDLRYCARTSRFRMPAARLGLGYGFDGIRHTVDAIGAARTAELFYTASTFDGAEAERIGLVHRAHDAEALDAEVHAVATAIAGNAPLTLRAAKMAIAHALRDPADRDAAAVDAAVDACFASADYIEGRRAFMEKRPPAFTGK